jgi:group I intron endonuclease
LSTISYFQGSLLTAPVIVFNNADTDKSEILAYTKAKTGIYLWTHKESNKMYIGSAIDLSKRLSNYYSLGYLTRYSNSIICNAFYSHGYSKFSLTIMELIDISNLNKDEIKKLILEKEQFYLDSFKPEYNILRIAGNLLGYKHSKETIAKMILAKSGKKNPLYGRTGVNSHLFGKTLSEEAKKNLSIVNKNKKYKQETLDKISLALTGSNNFQSKKVFLYSSENPLILYKEFETYTSAAEYIGCHSSHIRRIIDKDKLFKNKWILRSNLLNSDL